MNAEEMMKAGQDQPDQVTSIPLSSNLALRGGPRGYGVGQNPAGARAAGYEKPGGRGYDQRDPREQCKLISSEEASSHEDALHPIPDPINEDSRPEGHQNIGRDSWRDEEVTLW